MAPRGTNDSRRRLLLVGYWFPPAAGAAAERLHSFARYLPQYGWDVHVLTAAAASGASIEEDLVVSALVDPLGGAGPTLPDYDPERRRTGWLRLLRERVLFPDRFCCWARRVAAAGARMLQDERFDVVLASFPPASAVWAGLELHRASGMGLVLDFRDRWFGPGGHQPRTSRQRERHEELARAAVHRSSAVLAVSERMADAIAREHGYPRHQVHVVPNGYEPLAAGHQPLAAPGPGPLVIAHAGTVDPEDWARVFFPLALKLRIDRRLAGVRFRIVGNLSRRYLRRSGLEGFVETTGWVSRADAVREMFAAHALLVVTSRYMGEWGCSTKLFGYIQTGRPILCVEEAPGSNDRGLLERFAPDRCYFAAADDAEAVVREIGRLRDHVRAGPPATVRLPPGFEEFSRAVIAAKLAGILDGVAGSPP